MKAKNFKLAIPVLCMMILSGCKAENFFEVQEVMNPPGLTEKQQCIKDLVAERFENGFRWKYPLINGKYASVTDEIALSDTFLCILAFCQSEDESHKIHILLFNKDGQSFDVLDDISNTLLDVEEVIIRDIDNDGINEVIVFGKNFNTSKISIFAYKCDETGAKEIVLSRETEEKLSKLNKRGYKN